MKFVMRHSVVYFMVIIFTEAIDSPSINTSSLNQIIDVIVGRDIRLNCAISNKMQYKVLWLKNNMPLSINQLIAIRDERFKVIHSIDEHSIDHFDLIIDNVNPSDAGVYICQWNAADANQLYYELKVLTPPSIIDSLTSPSDIQIDETIKLVIECHAQGNPKPVIRWQREDGAAIKAHSKGNQLIFNRISRDDKGSYLCIASNGVLPSVSKRFVATVNYSPIIKVSHQVIGSIINDSIELECRCQGNPSPKVHWLTPSGHVIVRSTNKYRIKVEYTNEMIKMKLFISNLNSNDFGMYKCYAVNRLGQREGVLRLFILNKKKNQMNESIELNHTSTSSFMQLKINFFMFSILSFCVPMFINQNI